MGRGENFELVTLASLTVEKVQQIQGQQTALVTEKVLDITNPYYVYIYIYLEFIYTVYTVYFFEKALAPQGEHDLLY